MNETPMRNLVIALSLLVAGCAGEAVRTPEQAKRIALASPCTKQELVLAPNETRPTDWLAERRGDRWYVWLPYGPGAQFRGGPGQFTGEFGHMGAWINPKDGKVLYCEGR